MKKKKYANPETTMHKGLVQVEYKAFSASMMRSDCRKKGLRCSILHSRKLEGDVDSQKQRTGPMGIPAPPLYISLSSSSSSSSGSSSVYSESSFSEIGVCCVFSCTGVSPFEPGGWTAPEVIPSVSSGGRRWGIVGVGGTTTSVKSPTGTTEIASCGSCSCMPVVGFEVSAGWTSATSGSCCCSGVFDGAFSCGGGG